MTDFKSFLKLFGFECNYERISENEISVCGNSFSFQKNEEKLLISFGDFRRAFKVSDEETIPCTIVFSLVFSSTKNIPKASLFSRIFLLSTKIENGIIFAKNKDLKTIAMLFEKLGIECAFVVENFEKDFSEISKNIFLITEKNDIIENCKKSNLFLFNRAEEAVETASNNFKTIIKGE